MSYSIENTSIKLTRGDSMKLKVNINNPDGSYYIPEDGDIIRFAMKHSYEDEEPLVVKIIPNDTLILELDPNDTKHLSFGKYVYDIQLTNASGEVDTFITKASIRLTEEVD